MKRITLTSLLVVVALSTFGRAQEIDFVEQFALAADREEVLKQLIPGTQPYYYYHCLHYQNSQQFDKVEQMLKPWIKAHGVTNVVKEIQHRQALLTYEQNPQQSLEYVQRQLGIQFNHQRQIVDAKPNLPSVLDDSLISRQVLTQRALRGTKNTSGFESASFDWLIATDLTPNHRRHLLSRLTRPDLTNLPKLIVDDLNQKHSGGFGSLTIHRQLLLSQLDECLRLKPELLNQTNFVNIYLSKLQPNPDVDWQHDVSEHQAYLDRLWQFVNRLGATHNSLKASVLYQQLVLDRSRGKYDREKFLTYAKLPRNVYYINPEYMKRSESRRHAVNLQADYSKLIQFRPIGNDEPLVRSYLQHFFVDDTDTKMWEPYLRDTYLNRLFAETKIVNGLGDPKQWHAMISPDEFQALKDRVDLDFAFTNQQVYAADQAVGLDLDIKNVKTLIVKVFEVNTLNYYRSQQREVNTDMVLDGLVANHELRFSYEEPPLRRVRRHFDLPQLSRPGVYIVDFIGNGKSSRALVRKGKLRYLVRTNTAGQVLTILDQQNRKLRDTKVWLGGREYAANEDGEVLVPFSNRPGRVPIVITHGSFSSLDYLQHQSENYSLSAGFYVDRESLIKNRATKVIVRSGLHLNGIPVSLSVLENVQLTLHSVDHDDVTTTKHVEDFKLYEDRESLFEFQVPTRLSKLRIELTADVKNLSQNQTQTLSASETFAINQMERAAAIEDLHLSQSMGNYQIDLLGKSGEVKPSRPIALTIKHRDFRAPVKVTLKTDASGRIHLGKLSDIDHVQATSPDGVSQSWTLPHPQQTYYETVHRAAGQPFQIPYGGNSDSATREEFSLLESRGSTYIADHFDSLTIRDGALVIDGLSRGDYELTIKRPIVQRVRLRIGQGKASQGYLLGGKRQLEMRGQTPLQIQAVRHQDDQLHIQVDNATRFTRVHIIATRFQPTFSAFGQLSQVRDAEPYVMTVPRAPSVYVAGRKIGDEYQYILDRKYAKKYPGMMLQRPSLLLNPWAIRSTETGQQNAAGGDHFAAEPPARQSGGGRGGSRQQRKGLPGDFSNLDFLASPSVMLINQVPDEHGKLQIDLEQLGGLHMVHVVAVDPLSTCARRLVLSENEAPFVDLRLADGFDPNAHFTQKKTITTLRQDQPFEITDIATARFQAYDDLPSVYRLLATLSQNSHLTEFGFILDWPNKSLDDKNKLYSKYACHELNFFLYQKDPEFFEATIRPYLTNKKDKTFLDRWLLDEDLNDYLRPWKHARLNAVEKILLAQRIAGEPQATARHIQDLYDLKPTGRDQFVQLFQIAVKSSSLDTDDDYAFARERSERQSRHGKKSDWNGRQGQQSGQGRDGAAARGGFSGQAPNDDLDGLARELNKNIDMPRKAGEELRRISDIEKANELLKSKDLAGAIGNARGNAIPSDGYFRDGQDKRGKLAQLFRQLESTKEWVENHYYQLAIQQQNEHLVDVNTFWLEYAQHDPTTPFYCSSFAETAGNFSEMMFALAVLDLPWKRADHMIRYTDGKMQLHAKGPLVVFHEQLMPVRDLLNQTPILVSQNFFRHGDRYRQVDNEKVDKFVTDEFLTHVIYGCQVVVTNPTSSRQKIDVLFQIPEGAIPVLGGKYTKSVPVDLAPYHTQTVEYHFYFPTTGDFQHYPVHVSKNEQLMAFAEPVTFKVVDQLSHVDRESWAYVSQFGSDDQVIDFLNTHNLHRIDLGKIAFRMQDKDYFRTITNLIAKRHAYDSTLWSYGIRHNDVTKIREYLQYADQFVSTCGAALESPLVSIDPVVRKSYEHMEYWPLVNARSHRLGAKRRILNNRFYAQYHRLMKVLSYQHQLSEEARLAVTYYLLLQDRFEEAETFFGAINPARLVTRLQYDYFAAYFAMLNAKPDVARQIAQKHTGHSVDRWRNAFAAMIAQLDEIDGAATQITDADNHQQQQNQLASKSPSFEFQVENKQIRLAYQNLGQATINFYIMDIELLFSRNPFVQQYSHQFSHIRPNDSQQVQLAEDQSSVTLDLPEALHHSNVLVEIVAGGTSKSQAYYAHSLNVQMRDNYGQLRVTHDSTGRPLSKTYVKAYARMKDGSVRFYKDGYTDLRGWFDYTSLSTNQLDVVDRFSLLIYNDQHGAIVREALPPRQ